MSVNSSNHIIIGTAGHIDHGKSHLVRNLTGIETDRLQEEKTRGMSIELGFAYLDLEKNLRVGIIDVPGHKRFIRKMIGGAYGVDAIILVVDIVEGIKPQTVEHLDVVNLLGIKHGIIVASKVDLLQPDEADDMKQLFTEDIRNLTKNTFLAQSEIIFLSNKTLEGLDQLKKALKELSQVIEPKNDNGLLRLPIDRVFSLKGIGTVITGTLFSGKITTGNKVFIIPENVTCKVKSIQVHSEFKTEAIISQRTAVNLSDVSKDEINRGSTISIEGQLNPVKEVIAYFKHLPNALHTIKSNSLVNFCITTENCEAYIRSINKKSMSKGDELFVSIRLKNPTLCLRNDRFIVTSLAEESTLGGGIILDISPPKKLKNISLEYLNILKDCNDKEIIEYYLNNMKINSNVKELSQYFCVAPEKIEAIINSMIDKFIIIQAKNIKWIISKTTYQKLKIDLLNNLKKYFDEHPMSLDISIEDSKRLISKDVDANIFFQIIDELINENLILKENAFLKIKDRQLDLNDEDNKFLMDIEKFFLSKRMMPPEPHDYLKEFPNPKKAENIFYLLLKKGTLIKITEWYVIHQDIMKNAILSLDKHFQKSTDLSIENAKDIFNISRKYLIPLLEYFDSVKITQRKGSVRIKVNKP